MPEAFRRSPRPYWTELFGSDDDLTAVQAFTGPENFRLIPLSQRGDPTVTAQVYDTLHNTWVGVHYGDRILRGPLGEYYPNTAEAFKAYEHAHEMDPAIVSAADLDRVLTWVRQKYTGDDEEFISSVETLALRQNQAQRQHAAWQDQAVPV